MRPIAFALPLLVGCVVPTHAHLDRDSLSFPEPVDRVRFDLAAGDLSVEVADVAEILVDRTIAWDGARPELVARVVDGALVLTVDCSRTLFGGCRVDHTVYVPADVTLTGSTGAGDVFGADLRSADVVTGAGDVTLQGVAGAVVVDTGAGDVTLADVLGDVRVTTGAGDIDADRLTAADVWAHTGAGDVALGLDVAPRDTDVFSGAGDVTVRLPAGPVHLTTHTGAGEVTIHGVDRDPDAGVAVSLETGAGDILVRGR